VLIPLGIGTDNLCIDRVESRAFSLDNIISLNKQVRKRVGGAMIF